MGARVDAAKELPRGLAHPYVHVAYYVDGHDHILSGCSKDPEEGMGFYLEDVANELAEAVLRCAESKHIDSKGRTHGITHDPSHAEKAYKAAVEQLQFRDFWQEYVDIQRRIEHYQLWGNKHPADLVFQPNPEDPNDYLLFVKHPETGLPRVYHTKNLLDMPAPDPKKYAQGKLNFYRRGR